MKIFLSYPGKDKALALQLKDVLRQGGQVVWMDDHLTTGRQWRQQLADEIRKAGAIVLALTSNWLASPFCQWEFITAVEQGKKVVPVLLEAGLKLPRRLSQYQYVDFSAGFSDLAHVQQFLDDLLKLAVVIDQTVLKEMDPKESYAMQVDQENSGGGHNINVPGNNNTVAGGNLDQSRQSIRIGGDVSGGNVNIGGSQTFHGNVNIQYSALASAPADSPLQELKVLLQDLETALKNEPADKADDIELAQKHANEIAAESARAAPRKKWLEVSGDGLKKAAENLLGVAPIVAKIAQKLLVIG